jgi:peroxidase
MLKGILAANFKDWKYGDRWWFENGNDKKIKFTPPQLDEIRSTSFSKLICENIDVEYVQELAFLWPNAEYNPWIDCKKIEGINFSKWKEVEKKYIKINLIL